MVIPTKQSFHTFSDRNNNCAIFPRLGLMLPRNAIIAFFFIFFRIAAGSSSSVVESVAGASKSTVTRESSGSLSQKDDTKQNSMDTEDPIQVVFSDLDGTLVHYPTDENINEWKRKTSILELPTSSTGLRGVISSETLLKCRQIRRHAKLVIVSGMRTSTLLKRLPFLPLADAYCSESGRIFYPTDDLDNPLLVVTPEKYEGATKDDLAPFGLVEDIDWRNRMEEELGSRDSFMGVFPFHENDVVPLSERKGLLWEFARQLLAKEYVLDTKGYATCFRVNRKQQAGNNFEELLNSLESVLPSGLAASTNLGCLDVYPSSSGKKNCCQYLADKLGYPNALERSCICLCDDDNDLEMALACSHAYIPGITSTTMARIIKERPEHFTATCGSGENEVIDGTCSSTEAALALVLNEIAERNPQGE